MAALYLMRHGSTALNAETPGAERLRGWMDVGLATPGIIIARMAARALQPVGIQRLYTSDLKRAADTARIMSVTLALSVQPTRDLRPWNLGNLSGQPVSEGAPVLSKHMNGQRHIPVPGGESFQTFLTRWTDELRHLLHQVFLSDQNILAVTHARNLYALEEVLFKSPMPVKGPPHPGAVLQLEGDWGHVILRQVFPGDTGKETAS